MRIAALEYERLDLELGEPYQIAYETVSKSHNIILKVITDQGLTGFGCAAPDLEITGESPEDVLNQIRGPIQDLLRGGAAFRHTYYHAQLRKNSEVGPSACAMVDIALFDLLARKAGLPLYQLLGGYRSRILTSITIGIRPVGETIEQAGQFRKSGIEILEQPTHTRDPKGLRHVSRQIPEPVMADESIKSLADAYHLTRKGMMDMVNIKLQKVGGIQEAAHINSVAKAGGLEVMIGCLDECGLGISAGLHFIPSDAPGLGAVRV